MRLPVHRFCDLVYGWLVRDQDNEGRKKIVDHLNAPLPGEARRDPTPEELEAEYRAMMSIGQALS